MPENFGTPSDGGSGGGPLAAAIAGFVAMRRWSPSAVPGTYPLAPALVAEIQDL